MKKKSLLPSIVRDNVGAPANKMDELPALARTSASGALMLTEMWLHLQLLLRTLQGVFQVSKLRKIKR